MPFADADDFHPPANIAKMAAGTPLDDDDRRPWLEAIGAWLARHTESGGVVSCSALKRDYRDLLRAGASRVTFVHLAGTRDDRQARVADRPGHFMPTALLDSQLATLEPLQADEAGLRLDLDAPVEQIVDRYLLAQPPTPRSRAPPRGPTSLEPSDMTSSLLALAPSALAAADAPAIPAGRLVPAALVGIARDRPADHQVQGPPLPGLTIGSLAVAAVAGVPMTNAVASFTTGFGSTAAGRGHPDRARRDVRQAPRRLRRRRPDRRHDRRPLQQPDAAVGDGAVGALIGLPMFFEIGLVLLMPVIFLVARRSGLSLIGSASPRWPACR